MARPGRPERNRAARSFRQLRRFHHVINSNKVFGTHSRRRATRNLRGAPKPPNLSSTWHSLCICPSLFRDRGYVASALNAKSGGSFPPVFGSRHSTPAVPSPFLAFFLFFLHSSPS